MIKKAIFIVVCCAVLLPHLASACDVCGSSVGNLGAGLLTDYRSNFVRLGYSISPFQSSSERGYTIEDNFHQMDLSCRYSIADRILLMVQIPFAYKSRVIEGDQQIENGLGDISFSASYVLLKNKATLWNTNLYLEGGIGFSLPSGKYDENLHDKGLPEVFNLGRGALGYTFQSNAVWSYQSIGLVANVFYQLNSETESGYKFGNQFSARITGFKAVDKGSIQWIPNLGLGLETLSADRYANNNKVTDTEGQGLFLFSGINIKTQRWLAGLSYALPLVDRYGSETTTVKGRVSCQVSFLF